MDREKERELLRQAYKRCFQSDDGKKVLKDLEVFCGAFNTSVCEHNPNELQTFFVEGKRRVFLRVRQMIQESKNE